MYPLPYRGFQPVSTPFCLHPTLAHAKVSLRLVFFFFSLSGTFATFSLDPVWSAIAGEWPHLPGSELIGSLFLLPASRSIVWIDCREHSILFFFSPEPLISFLDSLFLKR